MAVELLSSLAPSLSNAHRIVETLVLRTKEGAVFTIDVGESLLPGHADLGAKITLASNPPIHVGICEGSTIEEVRDAAQQLVSAAMANGIAKSPVPKPHIKTTARVDA